MKINSWLLVVSTTIIAASIYCMCICTCICGWTIGTMPIHLIDVLFRDGCWDYCYNYFEIGEEMAGAVTPFRVALGMFACFEIGERTRELYNYVFNSQVGRACNNFLLHQDIPSQYTYISYVFNCIV